MSYWNFIYTEVEVLKFTKKMYPRHTKWKRLQ